MKEKIIRLNEKEQKDLFCAAWHLTNFIEDLKEEKVSNFSTPCETCKYQKECFEDDNYDAYSHFQILTKLTGVVVTPLKGARENSFKLLIEEDQTKETAQEVPVQEQPSQIIININSLTIDSKFADYLYKCLISYQYQLHKSSHPHH